jgi:hypothetical protein
MRARAREQTGVLAARVDQIWLWPDEKLVEAVGELLTAAAELGVSLVAMRGYPQQAVRVARLGLRVWRSLEESQRQALEQAILWVDTSHPEICELLAESARAGELGIATGLMMSIPRQRWPVLEQMPGSVEKVARVLDEGPDDEARVVAVWILKNLRGQRGVPALRRALRRPHYQLCHLALSTLRDLAPDALTSEELVELLARLIDHPPPTYRTEGCLSACAEMRGLLAAFLERLRPPAAIPLLERLRIASVPGVMKRADLDEFWGAYMLAKVFPETALPAIDEDRKDPSWPRRRDATSRARYLPDDLARPRLLVAATDGCPDVRGLAEEIWLQRHAEPCPVAPTAGVQLDLLAGPPSERMLARLEVMRRGALDARAAMAEVLLGEAPDPEALALLLFGAADTMLFDLRRRPGLPDSREAFVATLLERFGPPAATGLVAVAARYSGGLWSWLYTLRDLASKQRLPAFAHAPVRALALDFVRQQPDDPDSSALHLLAALGPPDDLFDMLWSRALDPALRGYERETATEVLGHCAPGDPARDGQILAEMTASQGDLRRFARAATVGVLRRQPAAIALTEQIVAAWSPTRPAHLGDIKALRLCIEALIAAQRWPESWIPPALEQPGTCLFAVAASAARSARTIPDPEPLIPLLRAGLTGDEPLTAAICAETLLLARMRGRELPVPLSLLLAPLDHAPAPLQASMIWLLAYHQTPVSLLWSHLRPLLCSPDRAVTHQLDSLLDKLIEAGYTEQLRALHPQIQSPILCARLLERLPPEPYWLDPDGPTIEQQMEEMERMIQEQRDRARQESEGEDEE